MTQGSIGLDEETRVAIYDKTTMQDQCPMPE